MIAFGEYRSEYKSEYKSVTEKSVQRRKEEKGPSIIIT